MYRLIPLTVALLAFAQPFRAGAQTFLGTNQPGAGSSFQFTLAAGTTNLSLMVPNSSTAFSHLYLKRGGVASLTNYDFVSRLDRTTNSINLEPPELVAGANYGLWVYTPTSSLAQAFTVSLTTNRADARLASMPILKPLAFSVSGTVAAGGAQYFQVDVPTNLPGWRLVLTSSGTADADLYIQRGALPSQTSFLKRSTGRAIDTVFLDSPEATNATYFISVLVPGTVGSATYTLGAEIAPVVTLNWEPGTTPSAVTAYTNQSALGGDYFFKITTVNPNWGAWRTRLDVQSGEADLFLRLTNLPTPTVYDYSSTQPGSDGLVLLTNQPVTVPFKAGQVWYAMVTATPGAQWSIYSGNLFITPLPSPAADTSGGTNTVFAPEGMNFYRLTINSNTIAWRLGLGGLTNNVFVHTNAPAFTSSTSYYEWKQSGQILIVPPYLKSGTEYFVTVVGSNTQPFTLDSRQQPIIEFPFGSATNVAASDYGYVTFHVQVPPDQIAWQVDLLASTGDPAIAVRQATVANEYISTALSATTNAPFETFTLVPPTLTDGSFYLTVWGTPPFTATLTNSRPVITPVDYTFVVTNDLPNRQGWRFYSVTNIVQQGGSLGWELLLNNYLPGTELAVRRNAVPGRWAYRTNYTQGISSAVTTLLDASSAKGFLQMPRHQADVWYIGVNNTNQALGPFVLTGSEIPVVPLPLGTDYSTNQVTAQQLGRFQYFHIEVPADALGLELQLANVTSGDPRLVVCRGELPVSLNTWLVTSNNWTPNTSTNWPIGAQVAYNTDWTGFTTDATGTSEQGRFFFASRGNPLEAGAYYVGVTNGPANTNEMNYDLLVRGVFLDGSVTDVTFSGSNSESNLAPHRVAWHRVVVPTNAPSWNLGLGLDAGDGFLVFRKDGLPNYGVIAGPSSSPTNLVGCLVRKTGDEHFLLLPNPPDTNVIPGTYYLGVVSEGRAPSGTRAGSNSCDFTFTSQGPLMPFSLGTVDPLGHTALVTRTNQDGGEMLGFQFSVLPNTPVFEVRLTNRVANPWMSLRADGLYGRPNDTAYGNLGGWPAGWSDANVIRVPWPVAGVYTLLVQAASTSGIYSNASYTLQVAAQAALTPDFDGGTITITNQSSDAWNYFLVRVPADALGWDLRLTNILKGDPRLVICRTNYPFNLTTRTATGGSWTPYTATNWPMAWQIAPDLDWTGYRQSAAGLNQAGTVFMAAMGNPLEPGDYVVGVASGTTGAGANPMSYTLVSRGIGTNYSISITPLAFSLGQGGSTSTPPREVVYYRVDVPNDSPSWQVHLDPTIGDAMLVIRKDGLPNFGATVTTPVTNLAGCKLQKVGDEQFVLLPVPPSNSIPAGTYYLGVVSEGQSPSGSKIGSSTSAYALQSIGNLPVRDLGTVDLTSYFSQDIVQAGGSVLAFQFTVPPNIPNMGPVVVRLDNRTNNPAETIRGGTVLPATLENYGRQGGWPADWSNPSYNRVDSAVAGGTYSVVIQAEGLSGLYPDASYTLRIYSLAYYSIPLAFDGGRTNFVGHPAGEWLYFTVDVPTNAVGWDLRLTNIISGSPRLVVCRSGWPSDLTSRSTNGTTWAWGAATNWPAGAQAAPGIDWTGYRYDINPLDSSGTNVIDTTGTVFAAGMGSPLEPGRYIVGVSSAPGTTAAMSYTIASRGIGPSFLVPVSNVSTGSSFVGVTGLAPREPAYYSIIVPTNTPLWKLGLAPSAGDALLAIRKDALPNVTATSNVLASALGGGHKFQKGAGENALLGEVTGQTNVPAGTYYVAVVGEGTAAQPAKGIIGTGTTDIGLTSALPSPATDLGIVVPGAADVLITNTLAPGETAAYQFTMLTSALYHTIRLENITGTPLVRLRNDQHLPLDVSPYGQDGNFLAAWTGLTNVINNPVNGRYSLSVLASGATTNWPPLQYTLRVHAETVPGILPFDGGSVQVNNQGSDWRVFAVTNVPTNALGWDLRLVNVSNGTPRLVIRRDQPPTSYSSSGVSFSSTTWPSLAQLAPVNDWTLLNEADGTSSTGRVFQVGMGNPLQPGTYYVGITNLDGAHPASYTVQSRGIGAGFSVGVEDLSFAGGSAAEVLSAREAAWYRVVVPNNAPSWKVALNFDAGDGLLMVQRGALPNLGAASANLLANITGGKKMQKLGDEHLLCLASGAGTSLTPGTYYLGVVSEGLNPSNAVSRIGLGSAAFTLYSDGSLPPLDLGWVGLEDLAGQAVLEGGECETWNFTVPPGILALQVTFDPAETTGNPVLTMTTGDYPPAALGYPLAAPTRYGTEGGVTTPQTLWALSNVTSVITIPNPAPNDFSITVQAAGSGINYPDADLTFRVRSLPIPELSFDATLNTNGLSNVVEAVLQDGFKDYWRVQVPYTMNGQPVMGWKLGLSALYGTPKMRLRRGTLPDDTVGGGTTTNFLRQAILVPDWMSPGTWYVEVTASGLTDYTLTSEALALAQPAWPMPAPGLPFADTGAVDLEQDSSHYYAVTVPPGNGGLLRTELDAISGNPNLYLRYKAPPTVSHNANGTSGAIYDRVLTNVFTEYGNWVALDGKSEVGLPPGTYYLAVHAGGSANRYRLLLSTGAIADLGFAGGSLTGQNLAGGDWRYYRVQLPVDMPDSWTIGVGTERGSIAVYLRDTIPPGLGTNVSDYVDWSEDGKNQGPYPSFTNAGNYMLSVPAVRPGDIYYVGVRALSDASFSVNSTPGPNLIVLDGIIPFAGGSVTTQIPAGGVLRYRIDAPSGAQTWSDSTSHASSVRLYLEQGTLPTMTLADHWFSSGANSTFNASLVNSSWPWLPGYHYFLNVANTSGSTQPFSFQMNCANPPLVISAPSVSPDGSNFVFAVTGSIGLTNRVEVSSDLAAGSWLVYTNFVQTGPTQVVKLPIEPNYPKRFYRIVTP
jgi:hypothetical protein